jgi:hypothetical protein
MQETRWVRLNIQISARLARELKRFVPPRQRSRFVEEAVERELRRRQRLAALEQSAGAWQDRDHPELNDGPAIDRWIAEGRAYLT